ncbi:MAG: hypothetical protein E6H09_05785 [Bacteroidetes bacterium]|jgi:outer membrane biogenesis lipoprotein LolB|nr:MAG: hypothetical protein E6H09_05785 [Bacteroidota bacterium]
MKKLFVVLAVASLGFAACNNSTSSEEQKRIDDSIAQKHTQDSLDALKPMTDTTIMKDTLHVDTTKH